MKNIFTKIALIVTLWFISATVFAQNFIGESGWDTLPWKSYADYRLQLLDKSYINTGLLYDRVFPIANMEDHTGIAGRSEDTTSQLAQVSDL